MKHNVNIQALLVGLSALVLLGSGCDPNRDLATYTCGDGVCDSGEDPTTCPTDCPANTCGNNVCDVGEDGASCAVDCTLTVCGDGNCEAPMENPAKCPADCGWAVCGNGVCEAGEENSCVEDCLAETCGNQICDYTETVVSCPSDCDVYANVDILFVIDNSGSMAGEQANLMANFPALYQAMRSAVGALPSLHIGVTTTDLGTGMFDITYCEDVGGDGGALRANPAAGLVDKPYMIDLAPEGCDVTRQSDGQCTSHNCDTSHCPVNSGAVVQLFEDAVNGCPRCRNFTQTAEDTFQALGDLGTMGCGFEQPLEAMKMALDSNAANTGFLRGDALLAVIIISDEDDCSAANPQLFDNTQTDINSTLGPLTSYRCFEFGVACDINSRTHQGLRQDCHPREDAAALLHPLSRYTNFLSGLKDPGKLVMAAIAGPVTPSPNMGYNMTVGINDMSHPALQYSCTTSTDGAVPAIRLRTLVDTFMSPADINAGAYSSICSGDYTPSLQSVGDYIRSRLGQ